MEVRKWRQRGAELPYSKWSWDEFQRALVVKEREVAEDVLFDFGGLGFGVELLQIGDDLGDGVSAVAARDDFEAGAVETQRPFGHQENTLIVVVTEAAACREAGFGIRVECHQASFSGINAPGG